MSLRCPNRSPPWRGWTYGHNTLARGTSKAHLLWKLAGRMGSYSFGRWECNLHRPQAEQRFGGVPRAMGVSSGNKAVLASIEHKVM